VTGLLLRPATEGDEKLLLEWRNEPETRRQSLQQAPVSPEQHAQWFRDRLARPTECRVYIAEVEGAPVGQARVDLTCEGRGEISVAVATGFRGRGLGRRLIAEATERAAAELGAHTVTAVVKSENIASLRAFEAAGYENPVPSERDGHPVLLLTWRAPTLSPARR
jgi:RimJ/RimL family protein N-acetyltransferase